MNGDAKQEQGEAISLTDAHISAIDFSTDPPAIVTTDGQRLALSETQITGTDGDKAWMDHGIQAGHVEGGTLVNHEEGGQTLYASVTHDYTGEEGHTHGGPMAEAMTIDAGDAWFQNGGALLYNGYLPFFLDVDYFGAAANDRRSILFA